jgi:hypothetical protein
MTCPAWLYRFCIVAVAFLLFVAVLFLRSVIVRLGGHQLMVDVV